MTIQLKDIALFILSVACVLLLLSQCNSCEHTPKIADNSKVKLAIDSLAKQDKVTEIKQAPIVAKIDSIALLSKQLSIVKAKLYKAGHTTIVSNPCDLDSILYAYDNLYNSCDNELIAYREAIKSWRYLDSLKQNRLDLRGSQIDNYKIILKSDSMAIDSLIRSKKKYWNGFKHGFVSGTLLTATGLGALIIVK